MVATNAFGLGVNKLNVRLVFHYGICLTMRNYVQETGRAGRDGLNASALLFYSLVDNRVMQAMISAKPRGSEGRAKAEYKDMVGYIGSTACRSSHIGSNFGFPDTAECGCCDNCVGKREGSDQDGVRYLLQVHNKLQTSHVNRLFSK
jgi:ATP-dependent DNA helicase RecQ